MRNSSDEHGKARRGGRKQVCSPAQRAVLGTRCWDTGDWEAQWGHGSSSLQSCGASPALHRAKSDVTEPAGDKALISVGANLPIINEHCCPDLLHKGGRGDVSWGFVFRRCF